jgi:hypothetical protein
LYLLYPPLLHLLYSSQAGTKLAVRKHVVAPAGAAQSAGCEDGKPAGRIQCVSCMK